MKGKYLTPFLLLPLLLSCGGSSEDTSDTSSEEPISSSDVPSSETPSSEATSSYDENAFHLTYASGGETAPGFDGAETLPTLDENVYVAFCPVSSGYSYVYTWYTDAGGTTTQFHGSWPGTAMNEYYDDNWYRVEYTLDPAYDKLNIIFNAGSGGAQTADLVMEEPGYYWFYPGDGDVKAEAPTSSYIKSAAFTDASTIKVLCSYNVTNVTLYEDGESIYETTTTHNGFNISFPANYEVDISKSYEVAVSFADGMGNDRVSVDLSAFYETDEFNASYAYTGNDLGVTLGTESTTFKVWSPFSSKIDLRVYTVGTPESLGGSDYYDTYAMTLGEQGVWSVTVDSNLNGYYYTYVVTNDSYTAKEIVDPYAKSAGINGVRGMILDLDSTDPEGWDEIDYLDYDRKELVVYETHIADLTSSSTWGGTSSNAKTFAGFHEAGTTYTENGTTVSTGFDHIKELGVNAVQILPMFDQSNDEVNISFNWGYNPLNYNVVEGSYSSNPYDGAIRVKELKELVMDYNKAGIEIIMDVVYNHVMTATGSNFDVLVPGYYFRYTSTGALYNGSGCGNETASNRYMFRKFMVDSTSFWMDEYKLGGYRFDLMGLHDLDTMAELTSACKTINPSAVIYGEPWTGGTSGLSGSKAATQSNVASYEGYGQFNDGMRDALIKGGLSAVTDKGWITSYDGATTTTAITYGIKGATYSSGVTFDPDKTVNYVTCHDNYTLYDRIAALYAGTEHEGDILNLATLAEAVVMTSQGTSFMLAGDEFARTKGGDHNSYDSGYEVNELDYSLKVQNQAMVENFKKLIALKTGFAGLHLAQEGAQALTISQGYSNSLLTYELSDGTSTYLIAHASPSLPSGSTIDASSYSEVYLDTLASGVTLSSSTSISPSQTLILKK